jgi:hypothetical protein
LRFPPEGLLLFKFSKAKGFDALLIRLSDEIDLFLLFLFTICHALGEEGGVDAGDEGEGRL